VPVGGDELAIARTLDSRSAKAEKIARNARATANFVEKHCKSDVSEEWKKVDDKKIAQLRGILAALQEENQSTQLLKKRERRQRG